jgi:hypothetical protein
MAIPTILIHTMRYACYISRRGAGALKSWMEEALNAPRDAWGLLLGIASALSIFALVRHEFTYEPLRIVLYNWQELSHAFWSTIGKFFDISLPKPLAIALTMALLGVAVLIRGTVRQQIVQIKFNFVFWLCAAVGWLIVGYLTLLAYSIGTPIAERRELDEGLRLVSAGVAGFGGGSLLAAALFTPRSFFGVVIAAIALLLIDQIPLLPAAAVAVR